MSKKSKKSMPTNHANKTPMKIDATELLVKAAPYAPPAFRSGKYMTEKDRPRKKNWMKEVW